MSARTRPRNREEAITSIFDERMHLMSATIALAMAFPLPGERERVDELLDALEDRPWAEYLRRAAQRIVDEWNKRPEPSGGTKAL